MSPKGFKRGWFSVRREIGKKKPRSLPAAGSMRFRSLFSYIHETELLTA